MCLLRYILLLLTTCVSAIPIQALAQSYEANLAEKLSARVSEEEVVWLTASGRRFLVLYKEDTSSSAAVILVHGMGGHPDWPEVVAPLRNGLFEMGFSTLSIQMPVLEPERQPADYGKTVKSGKLRLAAAVQFLGQKHEAVVIIGYGFGAGVAADYLAGENSKLIKAFAGISMQTQQFLNPRLNLLPRLEKLEIPVLDIYGSRDFVEVIKQVDDRRLAGRKNGSRGYQQMEIDGADHYFTGLEDIMIKRIGAWISRVVTGAEVAEDVEAE